MKIFSLMYSQEIERNIEQRNHIRVEIIEVFFIYIK